jgi:haloalkane dehalogenase
MTGVMQPARPAWVPKERYPFVDRYIEIDGNLVHYIDEGSGPLLLFLHGNPGWSFSYRGIISHLTDRFRCVAIDYPGFGLSIPAAGYDFRAYSHARLVETFIERLRLDGVTLVLHDWGGPIGLWFATRRPARVSALIIANTWAWPVRRLPIRLYSWIVGGPLGSLLVGGFNIFMNVFLPGGMKRRQLAPEEMAAYRGPFPRGHRRPMRVMAREIVASAGYLRELRGGLRRLESKPALILWADTDPAFGPGELAQWQAILPRNRTVELVGCGHFLEEDAPDEIAAAIRAWWTDVIVAAAIPVEPDEIARAVPATAG